MVKSDYINVSAGATFIMSMMLYKDRAYFNVEGQGELLYWFPEILAAPDEKFLGIGTRSNSGDGSCVIYVDDVYILRQSNPAATKLLLLD